MKKDTSTSKPGSATKDVLALDDFRNEPSIDDQALTWLVRLSDHDAGKASKETLASRAELRRNFFDWLQAAPEHSAAFDEAAKLWNISGDIVHKSVFQPQPKYRQAVATLMSAAALVLVAVLVMVASPIGYKTEAGEQRRIVLADGSTAFLNTDSELSVSMTDGYRQVELLQGEAWFDVVSNPDRPFLVTTQSVSVRAVGTAFAVHQTNSGNVVVTVTEGQVAVKRGSSVEQDADQFTKPLLVSAGQQFSQGNVSVVDTARAMSWQRGFLIYESVSIEELLGDLNRYVPRNMVLSDDKIAQVTVSAVIRIADQTAMLDALDVAMGLQWKAVSDELILVTPRAISK